MELVDGRGDEHLVGDLGDELRFAGPDHRVRRRRRVRARGIALLQLARERLIFVGSECATATSAIVPSASTTCTAHQSAKLPDGELGDPRERLAVVERARERVAGGDDEALAPRCSCGRGCRSRCRPRTRSSRLVAHRHRAAEVPAVVPSAASEAILDLERLAVRSVCSRRETAFGRSSGCDGGEPAFGPASVGSSPCTRTSGG